MRGALANAVEQIDVLLQVVSESPGLGIENAAYRNLLAQEARSCRHSHSCRKLEVVDLPPDALGVASCHLGLHSCMNNFALPKSAGVMT